MNRINSSKGIASSKAVAHITSLAVAEQIFVRHGKNLVVGSRSLPIIGTTPLASLKSQLANNFRILQHINNLEN